MAIRLGMTTSCPNSVTGSRQAALPSRATDSVIMAIQASFFRTWPTFSTPLYSANQAAAPVMISRFPDHLAGAEKPVITGKGISQDCG